MKRIQKIKVFREKRKLEAVISKNLSYIIKPSTGRKVDKYIFLLEVATWMYKHRQNEADVRKMPIKVWGDIFSYKSISDYNTIYSQWKTYANINEYGKSNKSPFALFLKKDNKETQIIDNKMKHDFALLFFHNDGKANKDSTSYWIGNANGSTEIEFLPPLEKYNWKSQYKERLLKELHDEESLKKERFIKLAAKKEDKSIEQLLLKKDKTFPPSQPYDIDNFLDEIEKVSQIVFVGEAGSGKSTTLRYYLKQCLEKPEKNDDTDKIPVFVPLIRFQERRYKDIPELIVSCINGVLQKPISDDQLNIFEDCVLLFDGLDEITDTGLLNIAIKDINRILLKSECKIVISCRKGDYQHNFHKLPYYELKELTDNKILTYLKSFLKQQTNKIFETKIAPDHNILSMARNPFLLSIITDKLKQHPNKALPRNKGTLIEEFIEKISSKKSRETINLPPIPKHIKHRFLGLLAFTMLDKGAKDELVCSPKIRNIIEDQWLEKPRTPPTEIILRAEKERLLKSGSATGNIVFIHRLIRDYFAAYHIKNSIHIEEQDITETVQPLLEYTKWDSAISLLTGIVSEDESEKIMELLADIDPYLSAECFSTAKKVSDKTENKLIHNLISLLKKEIEFNTITQKNSNLQLRICSGNMLKALTDFIFSIDNQQKRNDYTYLFANIDLPECTEILMNSLEEKAKAKKLGNDDSIIILLSNHSTVEFKDRSVNVIIETLEAHFYDRRIFYSSIYSLGIIGTERATNYLIELSEKHEDINVLVPILIATALTTPKHAITHLRNLLKKNPSAIKKIINGIRILHQFFNKTINETLKKLEDLIIGFVKDEHKASIKINAMTLLGKMKSKEAIPTLLKQLHSNTPSRFDWCTQPAIIALEDIGYLTEEIETSFAVLLKQKAEPKTKKAIELFIATALTKLNSKKNIDLTSKILNQIIQEAMTDKSSFMFEWEAKPRKLDNTVAESLFELIKNPNKTSSITAVFGILRYFLPEKLLELLIQQLKITDNHKLMYFVGKTIPYCSPKELQKSLTVLENIYSSNKNPAKDTYINEAIYQIKNKIGRRFLSAKT